MALVEQTNSSDLYEMRQQPDSTTTNTIKLHQMSPCRSGSKKSILRDKASSPLSSQQSDEGTIASSSSSSSRVSFVEDDITETRFYDTTAAAKAVSSTAACQQPHLPNNTATLHFLKSCPIWMGDCTLLGSDVFHKRLNRPAITIQAIVRGVIQRRKYRQERIMRLRQELYALEFYAVSMIQARIRGMQQRKHYAKCRAIMPMQALVRGWLCRLKLHVKHLHKRLDMVITRHAQELHQIEEYKQNEMKRIYKDLHEIDAKMRKKQDEQRKQVNHVIEELRNSNTKLRSQNDTLHKAIIVMAKKNERTMKLTQALYQNIHEVESTLPALNADHDNITRIHRECKQVVFQYETALATCEENLLGEKKISDFFFHGIENMLQKIEQQATNSNEKHSNSNQKLGHVLRKSCSRRIRIALKEQEKSNQLARGDDVVVDIETATTTTTSNIISCTIPRRLEIV